MHCQKEIAFVSNSPQKSMKINKDLFANSVSPPPSDEPSEDDERGNYFYDLRQMYLLFRVLGFLPFRLRDSGVTVKLCCPLMLYTLLIQAGMMVVGGFVWKYRIDYLKRLKLDFSELMLESTFIAVFIPLFLAPFAHLPEAGKKARFISNWKKLQKGYRDVTGKSLNLNMRKTVFRLLILLIVITALVASFPFVSMEEIEPWFAVPLFYSLLLSVMNTGMWYVNGKELIIAGRKLMAHLEENIMKYNFNCKEKIQDYKMLWLQMSKLTQEMGTSMGFTYGTQILCYFFEQVLAVYGLIINFQKGLEMNNFVFVASAAIFSWLIFVTCNTAQRATEEVGINIQEKLQKLYNQVPPDCIDSKQEIRSFVEAVVENPPVINLSGFVVVNRSLQTSLMSAMVTYLVVLIQFQLSTEPEKSANGNSSFLNKSDA